MDIKTLGPYITMGGLVIAAVTYIGSRDTRITERATTATQVTIAISALENKFDKMEETFRQSLEALKSQQWMEHGRAEGDIEKLEGKYHTLKEEVAQLRLLMLENDNARLRALIK